MNIENTAQPLDANELNAFVEIDVLQMVIGTIQVELMTGTFATAELTVYRSNDGVNWQVMILPMPLTITAVGFTVRIDTDDMARIKIEVTTVEGGESQLSVVPCFKGYP